MILALLSWVEHLSNTLLAISKIGLLFANLVHLFKMYLIDISLKTLSLRKHNMCLQGVLGTETICMSNLYCGQMDYKSLLIVYLFPHCYQLYVALPIHCPHSYFQLNNLNMRSIILSEIYKSSNEYKHPFHASLNHNPTLILVQNIANHYRQVTLYASMLLLQNKRTIVSNFLCL